MDTTLNRRNFIKKLGISTAVLSGMTPKPVYSIANKKPNIVFFYADDLDFDEIKSYDIDKFPCYTGAKKQGHYRIQKDGWFVQNNRRLKRGEHGFYDDERMLTPNIDKLAGEGASFSRFYITSSISRTW